MSDPEKSGTPDVASADLSAPASAPAEAAPASPAGQAPVSAPAAFGSFGATRGSGLARGKRPAVAAASASASTPAGYKPTALEVITPQTEYKNPFTGETSVSAPRANEPVPPAVPLPSTSAINEVAASTPVQSPVPESSASLDATARNAASAPAVQTGQAETTQLPAETTATKPELNILPPENPRRPAVRWESNAATDAPAESAQRPDERRTFQPRDRREGNREQREGRSHEPRQPRDPREQREPRSFEPREPRRDDRKFEPRTNQPHVERAPRPEPEKKSGGFIGWLKGLFGGKPEAPAPSQGNAPGGENRRDSDSRHGGHRGGGRGRGGQGGYRGDNRGPRPEGQQGQRGEPGSGSYQQGGENRGENRGESEYGGQRRRRRRGGRGRFRSEGGGDHGGPRPEGQQGGGAI